MNEFRDLTGQRFGRLIAIERVANSSVSAAARWRVNCDCGGSTVVYSFGLISGDSKSCGCLKRQTAATLNVWRGLVFRSAVIPQEWKDDFECFKAAVGLQPTEEHSLVRVNAKAPYSASNCYWDTREKPTPFIGDLLSSITYKGKTQSLAKWCRELGLNHTTVASRLRTGFTPEAALTTPIKKLKPKRTVEHQGQVISARRLCELKDIPYSAFMKNLEKGMSIDQALERGLAFKERKLSTVNELVSV